MSSDNGNQIKMSEEKNHFNINVSAFKTLWRFYAISADVILWLMRASSRAEWVGGVGGGWGGGGSLHAASSTDNNV